MDETMSREKRKVNKGATVAATAFREKKPGVGEKLRNVGEKNPDIGESFGNVGEQFPIT